MKPSAVAALLSRLIPLREPVLLVGSPGTGKSDTVEQATHAAGHEMIITHPVVSDPTDYKGLPYAGTFEGEAAAHFLPFGDLWKMIKAEVPTVVFFDDLGQSTPAVQAALMQLVLARRINGHKISDMVTFLAATNRRQDRAAVTGLITPLLDRFSTVITMEFDLDDWCRWGIQNGMPVELLAFARFRPDLINKFEANKDMKKSPTPRSVATLGRLFNAGIREFEPVAGCVGEGMASEFLAFYRTFAALPDRNQIYMNPETTPVPEKTDVLYALMGSLAHGANMDNIEQTVRYINRCPPEMAALCMRDALERTPTLSKTHSFTKWMMDNSKVFGSN